MLFVLYGLRDASRTYNQRYSGEEVLMKLT